MFKISCLIVEEVLKIAPTITSRIEIAESKYYLDRVFCLITQSA